MSRCSISVMYQTNVSHHRVSCDKKGTAVPLNDQGWRLCCDDHIDESGMVYDAHGA